MITDQIASRSGKDFSSNQVSLPSAGKNGSRSGGSVTSVGDSRCHLYGLAVDGTSQWGPSGANYRSECDHPDLSNTESNTEILYTKFLQLLTRPDRTPEKEVLSPSNGNGRRARRYSSERRA